MSTFSAGNIRRAVHGLDRLKQTIRRRAASIKERFCPRKVGVMADPAGNTLNEATDKLVETLLGDETDPIKLFAKNRWTRERQVFGVGDARECVRMAIARTINHYLDKYLQDSDRTIIDVGAGEGWLPGVIHKKWLEGGRYIPFDINPNFLERITERGLCKKTIEGDVYDLSRHVQNADAIIACDSYDTFEDLEKAVEESYKALRQGGKLLIFQTLRVASSALYRKAMEAGLSYSAPIEAFFADRNDLTDVMILYIKARLKRTLGVATDPDYIAYARLRSRLALDVNTKLFFPRMARAVHDAGFVIKVAGIQVSNVLADKEPRHANLNSDYGITSIPACANLVFMCHGILDFQGSPDIPPGKILEQAEVIVVVAEKH